MLRSFLIFAFLILSHLLSGDQLVAKSNDTTKLYALLEEDWQWQLKQFPEDATCLGFNAYNDRLTDLSLDAIEKRKKHQLEMLQKIRQIDRSQLAGQDLISYDLFLWDKELAVEDHSFPSETFFYRGIQGDKQLVNHLQGLHLEFLMTLGQMPVTSIKDLQNYITRAQAFPTLIDQLIILLRAGIEKEWVHEAESIRNVPEQLEKLIVSDATQSKVFAPFEQLPATIADGEKIKLTSACQEAITKAYIPALKKYLQFIQDTYLPADREESGCLALPNGKAFYANRIRHFTSTRLSPQEIYQIGIQEIARIHSEIEAIKKEVKFNGSLQDFLIFLKTDSRFYDNEPSAYLNGFKEICKRAEPELARLFLETPQIAFMIEALPPYEFPGAVRSRFERATADGSRPGYFRVNTHELFNKAKYRMEAIALQNTIPGYHLLYSGTTALTRLHPFRRYHTEPVYRDGWALYASDLGFEMDFYRTPYTKLGHLSEDLWYSCGLVVDTGIHVMGWNRKRAIDYLLENTDRSKEYVIAEVDRYITCPGQVLSFKMGQLKIKELRDKAATALGDRFDARKFHRAILDNGALPLEILERVINNWIEEQKEKGN